MANSQQIILWGTVGSGKTMALLAMHHWCIDVNQGAYPSPDLEEQAKLVELASKVSKTSHIPTEILHDLEFKEPYGTGLKFDVVALPGEYWMEPRKTPETEVYKTICDYMGEDDRTLVILANPFLLTNQIAHTALLEMILRFLPETREPENALRAALYVLFSELTDVVPSKSSADDFMKALPTRFGIDDAVIGELQAALRNAKAATTAEARRACLARGDEPVPGIAAIAKSIVFGKGRQHRVIQRLIGRLAEKRPPPDQIALVFTRADVMTLIPSFRNGGPHRPLLQEGWKSFMGKDSGRARPHLSFISEAKYRPNEEHLMRDVVFDVASVGHLLDQVGGVRLRSQINREMKAVDRALTSSLTEIETLMSQLTTVAEAMEKAVQENDSKWWVSNAKVRDFAKSAKTSTEQVRKGCEESLRAALRTCAERLAIAGAKVGEI